jgi:hypothetical protein
MQTLFSFGPAVLATAAMTTTGLASYALRFYSAHLCIAIGGDYGNLA